MKTIGFGRFLGILVLVVSLFTSLMVLQRRANFERMNNQVELAVSYSELKQMAVVGGMSFQELLEKVKAETDLTSISLEEDTLESYVNEGRVTVLKGSEVMNLYRIGHVNRYILTNLYKNVRIEPEKFYLVVDQKEDFDRLKDFLSVEYGKDQVVVIGHQNILEVMDEKEQLLNVGLGISGERIQELESVGFKVIPRFKNSIRLNRDIIRAKFRSIQDFSPVSTIVFEGNSVLGYPNELPMVEHKIRDLNLNLGMIEFSNQSGMKELAGTLSDSVIRVHSISTEEMAFYTQKRAINRYLRAAKERGVKILFLRPYIGTVVSDNIIQSNIDYFNDISGILKRGGKVIEPVGTEQLKAYHGANPMESFVIVLGIFVVFWATLTLFISFRGYSWLWACGIFLAAYFIKDLFQVYYDDITVIYMLWDRFWALVAAVSFPTYAIISQFPKAKSLPSYAPQERILPIIGFILKSVGICFVGSLFIGGLLSDITYLLGIRLFFGVKISFLLPLFLIGLYFYLNENRLSSIFYVFKRLVMSPVRTMSLLAFFVCSLFIFLYILRSGNYMTFSVPYIEHVLREFMEDTLFIRPRTKEILIGYPMLIFSVYYLGRGFQENWSWFFNALGSVALISFINSFCHLHTPLWVSTYRMILGVVLGCLIGIIYSFGIAVFKRIFKRLV